MSQEENGEDAILSFIKQLQEEGCGTRIVEVKVSDKEFAEYIKKNMSWCKSVMVRHAKLPELVTVQFNNVAFHGHPDGNELLALFGSIWDATQDANLAESVVSYASAAGYEVALPTLVKCSSDKCIDLTSFPDKVAVLTTSTCGYCPYAVMALASLSRLGGFVLEVYNVSTSREMAEEAEKVYRAFVSLAGEEYTSTPTTVIVWGDKKDVVVGSPANLLSSIMFFMSKLGAVKDYKRLAADILNVLNSQAPTRGE
jgi:thiol-disulfide isomerase/thioredoxin